MQLPQWVGSVCVFTQLVPHISCPAEQLPLPLLPPEAALPPVPEPDVAPVPPEASVPPDADVAPVPAVPPEPPAPGLSVFAEQLIAKSAVLTRLTNKKRYELRSHVDAFSRSNPGRGPTSGRVIFCRSAVDAFFQQRRDTPYIFVPSGPEVPALVEPPGAPPATIRADVALQWIELHPRSLGWMEP